MYSLNVTQCVGFPIRKSPDRSLFAAPRGLSQLVTSFIGSWCQGIRPVLFFAWTSYLYSLFSELLEFLRKQDKFSHWKGFFLFVSLVSTFRWNCIASFDAFTLFGKTQLISQFCPLLSVRFLLILSKFLWIFSSIRLSSFMCRGFPTGRSGWTRTIDLTLIRRALYPPELQTGFFSGYLVRSISQGSLLDGGDEGIRTLDPLLAGQVLSQLSYTPILLGVLRLFLIEAWQLNNKIYRYLRTHSVWFIVLIWLRVLNLPL